MTKSLRLTDSQTQARLVVQPDQNRVFAEQPGTGEVRADQQVTGETARAALEAARQLDSLFVVPFPGARASPSARFTSGGVVNQRELAALERGEGIPAARSHLQHHLDFFDRTHDGSITLGENYKGWRELGLGRVGATTKAAMSGVVFGRIWNDFAIDTQKIGKRYDGTTGIFDAQGNLDEAKLQEYLVEFDARGQDGTLTQAQVLELLKEKSPRGTVSKGQFRSLFEVCTQLNGGKKVVTGEQFRALFDGSLLYLAASMADRSGHRRLREG